MSYPLSPYSYLQIAQALPRPSPVQCERFREHIATARRWFELLPIAGDDELRAFAENYVREELAGFQCPADREAWEVRQLEAFRQLYAPRNAAQLMRLRHALDALLTWIFRT